MASSYSTDLKLEIMVTGEKAGLWGDITNTNLVILQQAIAGFQQVALNATTGAALAFTNAAVSNGKNAVIELTGTITGNVDVTIPSTVTNKVYIIKNSTSGAFSVTVKVTGQTGVTFSATDKGAKVLYINGTDVADSNVGKLSNDYAPQLSAVLDTNGNDIVIDTGGAIEDDSNNEYIKFSKTASAVNEITVANAATTGAPNVSVTGSDTNIDLNLTPKGIGRVTLNGNGKINGIAEKVTTVGAFDSDINIDTNTQGVVLSTATATANFTINLRGDGSNSLDASMDNGESVTIAYINKNNNVTYYNTTVKVDGSVVTPVWQGGAAPAGGNVTSNDVYTLFLVVAGGGGGGGDNGGGSGGGGAGGYRNSYSTESSGGGGSSESSLTFDIGTVYTITVGAGGARGTGPGTRFKWCRFLNFRNRNNNNNFIRWWRRWC
jgi:hypothetical protein